MLLKKAQISFSCFLAIVVSLLFQRKVPAQLFSSFFSPWHGTYLLWLFHYFLNTFSHGFIIWFQEKKIPIYFTNWIFNVIFIQLVLFRIQAKLSPYSAQQVFVNGIGKKYIYILNGHHLSGNSNKQYITWNTDNGVVFLQQISILLLLFLLIFDIFRS